MIDRMAIVTEARRWIGTPYRHQASTLGAGADCLGLIRGVWRRLIGDEPEEVPPYSSDWSEPKGEELLYFAARRHFIETRVDCTEIGQVLLFRMSSESVAKHLAVSATKDGLPTFIHSYTDHGVVENHLSLAWRRKIIGRFDFPKGAE